MIISLPCDLSAKTARGRSRSPLQRRERCPFPLRLRRPDNRCRDYLEAWIQQRDALDARAIEAPAGPIAGVRGNRMNAGLRLGLFEDFDFAAFHVCRVIDG